MYIWSLYGWGKADSSQSPMQKNTGRTEVKPQLTLPRVQRSQMAGTCASGPDAASRKGCAHAEAGLPCREKGWTFQGFAMKHGQACPLQSLATSCSPPLLTMPLNTRPQPPFTPNPGQSLSVFSQPWPLLVNLF